MQVLFLALDCPLPATNGAHLRTLSVLQALRDEGCHTSLVCLRAASPPRERAGLEQLCDSFWILNHAAPSLSGSHISGRLLSAATALPYAVRRFRSPDARALLRRLYPSRRWDAVICDMAYGAVNLPAGAGPLVLNHHNIEHRILSTYADHQRQWWRRTAARWESARLQRWEANVGQRAAAQWVCSAADRDWLRKLQPQARVAVVPNVVTAPAAVPALLEDPDLVLFPAALDWLPNRDAVDYFLGEIWPHIRAQAPGARFVAAGRNPPPAWRERHRQQPGVDFTGTVADMLPWLARAAVVVVPLRIGSGTRLKILEAAGAAKPVVSTRRGAEGLDFAPGSEMLLADEPSDFAAAVLELLAAPARRRALGHRARDRVRALYSPAALRRSLRQALAEVGGEAETLEEGPLQEARA